MDRYEAARTLGQADADVLGVEETGDGTKVTARDGGDRLITDDGVFALSDHPATAQLRRWDGDVEAAENAEYHLTPKDGSGVPSGTADDVLTWVGEDRERAADALAVEERREHPRSTLAGKLRKLVDA